MSIADDFKRALKPWSTPDLDDYAEAIAEGVFGEVEALAEDTETREGWTHLMDPDEAPAGALPWLAQFVGERIREGTSEALAREWIKDAPNQRRGTIMSIVRAAQRTLAGQRTVQITERTPTDDHLSVVTYTSETPYPDLVLADLKTVVPADIVLNYQVLASQTYSAAMSGKATYNAMDTAYTTYQNMRDTLTGYTTYTRPAP